MVQLASSERPIADRLPRTWAIQYVFPFHLEVFKLRPISGEELVDLQSNKLFSSDKAQLTNISPFPYQLDLGHLLE